MQQALRTENTPKHVRKPLTESKALKDVPFQLLPNAVYRPDELERVCVWQEQFARSAEFYPQIEVITVGETTNDLLVTESLRLQSVPALAERTLKPKALLTRTEAEYCLVVSPETILNPQSLFILEKELRQEAVDLLSCNKVILSANTKRATKYIRRAAATNINLLSYPVLGEPLLISKRLFDAFDYDRFESFAGFRWAMSLFAEQQHFAIKHLPLSLAMKADSSRAIIGETEATKIVSDFAPSSLESLTPTTVGPQQEFALLPRFSLPEGAIEVVIPFRDQAETTATCVRSLLRQSEAKNLHLTLVDNGSSEAEFKKIETEFASHAQIELISDSGYFNYARLNNLGAKNSTSEFILLLNNDVEFAETDTVAELKRVMSLNEVGIVGGTLKYPDGALQHGGMSFIDSMPINVVTAWDYADLFRETDGMSFAMALIRREVFESLGGLDESLCPNGFGDALFCARARAQGWKTVFTPAATATHYESKSRRKQPEELELLEIDRNGIPLPNLSSGFHSERKQQVINMDIVEGPPAVVLLNRLLAKPALGRFLNSSAALLLKLVRGFK